MKFELTVTTKKKRHNIIQVDTRFKELTAAQNYKIQKIDGVVQLKTYDYCFCLKVGKLFTPEEIETELKKILRTDNLL